MLDAVDLKLNRRAQRQRLSETIPQLRAKLEAARQQYRNMVMWPSDPALGDDTWGAPTWDNLYHSRAATRVESADDGLKEALHYLDLLENAQLSAVRRTRPAGVRDYGPPDPTSSSAPGSVPARTGNHPKNPPPERAP
jgi:hypothetical protein